MLRVYFAIFYPQDGGWGVRFPDAPSVLTGADTLEEALEMAVDALSAMLVTGRKGREYFEPRGFDEIFKEANEEDYVFPVTPDESIMEEYRPKKRVNMSMPVDLLKRVDKIVKEDKRLDRSKFFTLAGEKYLAEI